MQRSAKNIISLIIGMTLCATTAWAADYSGFSNDDMANQRGSLRAATEQERNDYHEEWQKRMKEISPEERTQYREKTQSRIQDGERLGNGPGQPRGNSRGGNSGGGRGHGGGGGRR